MLDLLKIQKGFIALTTVLIISAIVLMVGIGLSLRSINEAEMSLQGNLSLQAHYLANLCAEQALMRLKEDSNYTGDETINMENGSCQILPIEGNWIVKVSATSFDQVNKIKILIDQINPEMIIDSWSEVADF